MHRAATGFPSAQFSCGGSCRLRGKGNRTDKVFCTLSVEGGHAQQHFRAEPQLAALDLPQIVGREGKCLCRPGRIDTPQQARQSYAPGNLQVGALPVGALLLPAIVSPQL